VRSAILERLKGYEPDLISIRREIHSHPETGFEEVRTAKLVAERLRGWGIDVAEGIARTGVVGSLLERGPDARSGCVPTLMRCTSRKCPVVCTDPRYPVRCMPAAMTGTRQCCLAPHGISTPGP
jgi:hypothetical protein